MSIEVQWAAGHDRFPRLHWVLDEKAFNAFSQYGIVHELTASENVFEQGRTSDELRQLWDADFWRETFSREVVDEWDRLIGAFNDATGLAQGDAT